MITPTSSKMIQRTLALVLGASGSGKSVFAASDSTDAPPHLSAVVAAPPAGTTPVVLRDMAWLAYDRGACTGFEALGLEVSLYYDLSDVAPNRILEESLEVIADIGKRGVSKVVVDTGTVLDIQLQSRHKAKEQTDKRAYFAAILGDWTTYHNALRRLDADVQILAHIKRAFDGDDGSGKAQRAIVGDPDYSAQITGQALNRIKADCDFILPLRRKWVLEGKTRVQRVMIQTQPGNGAECKIRGGAGLPDEMDADWRLLRAALRGTP